MPAKTSPDQALERVTRRDITQNKTVILEKTYPKQLILWQTY